MSGSPRLAGWFTLAAASVLLLSLSSFAAEKPEALVPANLSQQMDERGMRWDLTQNGSINDGTNDCFDTGGLLHIGRSQVAFTRPMMTPDGSEFVFTGKIRELAVTRRARVDVKNAAMRYLESVTNTGKAEVTVQLMISSTLGNNAQQVIDADQRPFAGVLGDKQNAFATLGADSRPGVIFLVAGPRGEARPAVSIQNNRRFDVTYNLTIPPGATRTVLHYMAQRPGVTAQEIRTLETAYLKRGRLVDPTIPKTTLETLVNFKAGPAEPEAPASILSTLNELAKADEVERGERDMLLIDASTKLAGAVNGNSFELETSFGKTRIAFEELAGVAGGEGVQRAVRVFLRSGDVLSGSVSGAEYQMETENGLKLPIDFNTIHLLILRTSSRDANAGEQPLWLVSTHRGDRLVIGADAAAQLEAATPWGPLRLPLSEVAGLTYLREPFPAHRLVEINGNRLLVMLRGGELTLPGTRFGAVKLMPQMIRGIERVTSAPALAEGAEPDEDQVKAAHCELTGENRLIGALDLKELHLATDAGVTPIATSAIARLTANEGKDDSETGPQQWTVELAGEQELRGRLVEKTLPIRSADRSWNVPVSHLVSYHAPPPVKEAAPPVENSPDKPALEPPAAATPDKAAPDKAAPDKAAPDKAAPPPSARPAAAASPSAP